MSLEARHPPEDDDALLDEVPPRRSIFPPSFFALLALGMVIFAAEPTAELGYRLLGPGGQGAIDLGEPGEYRLGEATDGARARISGFAGNRRGTYSLGLSEYEVFALTGLPVLVRRPRGEAPPPNTVELYRGEGRLLRLEDAPAGWADRMVRPAARYTRMKDLFVSAGELPPGREAWLLLEGELPRSASLLWAPALLWVAAVFFSLLAVRAHRRRREAREFFRRLAARH